MAKFEGVKWAPKQMRYLLTDKSFEMLSPDSQIYAVSRSIHYGLFLCFEGIRFFCKKNNKGNLEIAFVNWDQNLERFRRGIAFNLGTEQQHLVPTIDELVSIFIKRYFSDPSMHEFLEEMATLSAQGYLRPFTVDEEQSIGVTFPAIPSIRAVACRYDRYLGEPFCGVVVPHLIRAVSINKTGCLKLGINYLMSVKAVDEAKKICPDAASALFLDDKPENKLEDRMISEWDSSCCLFALSDGTVVKIPEHALILPSVTIQGIVAILREMGTPVVERFMSYGELIHLAKNNQLITVCSIGTAGILNRCHQLILVDNNLNTIHTHYPLVDHPLFTKLAHAKQRFWDVYQDKAKPWGQSRKITYTVT